MFALAAYGAHGVWTDRLLVPTRRYIFELSGVVAMIMYAAALCVCANMLAVVVDHYDKRDNEQTYKLVIDRVGFVSILLAATALLWHLVLRFK